MLTDQNILTEKRFEDLFHTLYVRLCRTSLRIVQDEHQAEDIVQDVFCTLWRRKEELTHIESFEGYLLRSVYNASLNVLKKEKAQAFNAIEDETVEWVDTNSVNPEQQMHFVEMQEKVNKAIESLPTACRAIFVLSRFENRTNKEIASELDLSIKTVENQMTKALRLLRQALLFLLLIMQQKF